MLLRRVRCLLMPMIHKSLTQTMTFLELKKLLTLILLASADKWFAQNGMKRNSSKYQAMVLGKNKGAELAFKCDESQTPISKTMELLGVTIDDKLNFENHIAKICRKVSQQIAVLKRMQKLLPFETRRDLYKAFILPHFNYCSETWHFCSKKSADKLEMVNKTSAPFCFQGKVHAL